MTQPNSDWKPVLDDSNAIAEVALAQEQQEQQHPEVVLNPNTNMISISIGVKYGEDGPSTNLNFAFDPDRPQDLTL